MWDRYNYGLKTHFYSFLEAFRLVGNPDRRFALLNESHSIVPNPYRRILRNKSYMEKEFDLVFTYDYEVLNTLSNARFGPIDANYWYGREDSTAISPENYMNKDKNVSIIASFKTMCPMHIICQNIARMCKANRLADTFGTFTDGWGGYCKIELPLQRYRYSIIIDNDLTPFYFTEKITNCFISQTIPIYLGATQIHKFFNPDGIITISMKDLDNLEEVLKQCTPEDYQSRLPAVLDNFQRVQKYAVPDDYMYEEYLRHYFE